MTTRSTLGDSNRIRLVILGGGAGGLELAAALGGSDDFEVVLVDRDATHIWKPRLHEFAAGTVSSQLSELSFYVLARLRDFRFELGAVEAIDREKRTVRLAAVVGPAGRIATPPRELGYDYCVVALGGTTPDFGISGVVENAIILNDHADADDFRRRLIALMLRVQATGKPGRVTIIGTGATGIELAAHLRTAEMAFVDRREEGKRHLLDIVLIEAMPQPMPGFDDEVRQSVLERLSELSISVHTGKPVTAVEHDRVIARGGEEWESDLTVWATGLIGAEVLPQLADFELDHRNRIKVDPWLRTTVDDRIFAIGDAASLVPEGDTEPLRPTAQAAHQQVEWLSSNLRPLIRGESLEKFSFHDRGSLLSVAARGTVGKIGLGQRRDIFVDGRFAAAAYRALLRQHQWAVLGLWRGTIAIAADALAPTGGPALKLH